jgi:5-methylcytosine-specific restriction endonuclease McrA
VRLKREITGSHPAEQPIACMVWIRNCDQCKRLFPARRRTQVTCSRDCSKARSNRLTSEALTKRYHSDPDYRDSVLARSHARHAHDLGLDSHLIAEGYGLLTYLIRRDHGRCGICHKAVRAKSGPMRPGIDHIVPLSRGGTHELANLQLSHHWCNLSKNNRGSGAQLLLVG